MFINIRPAGRRMLPDLASIVEAEVLGLLAKAEFPPQIERKQIKELNARISTSYNSPGQLAPLRKGELKGAVREALGQHHYVRRTDRLSTESGRSYRSYYLRQNPEEKTYKTAPESGVHNSLPR